MKNSFLNQYFASAVYSWHVSRVFRTLSCLGLFVSVLAGAIALSSNQITGLTFINIFFMLMCAFDIAFALSGKGNFDEWWTRTGT